jgi:hypothetical protein
LAAAHLTACACCACGDIAPHRNYQEREFGLTAACPADSQTDSDWGAAIELALRRRQKHRDTFTFAQPSPQVSPEASEKERIIAWVHYQLDCIGPDEELLDGLVLLGNEWLNRLQGGAHACFSCMPC